MCWTVVALLVATAPQPIEQPAWLGISMAPYGTRIEYRGRVFEGGIQIGNVLADSPAEAAGLQAGDVIVEFDGTPFQCDEKELIAGFRESIGASKPGQTVEEGTQIAEDLMKKFEIRDDDLIDRAYIDLLLEKV